MSVVHDASSLLAVAFREPGGEVARSALRGSLVSSVNWSEVIQKVQARGKDTRQLAGLYAGLGVTIVPFGVETAERAASLYGETRAFGLSLGDRACLALGLETGREVYTADKRWTEIPLEIKVKAIRP
jgi:ribonuclease VapC